MEEMRMEVRFLQLSIWNHVNVLHNLKIKLNKKEKAISKAQKQSETNVPNCI